MKNSVCFAVVFCFCVPALAQSSSTIGASAGELTKKWGQGVPYKGFLPLTYYKGRAVKVTTDHVFTVDLAQQAMTLAQARAYAKSLVPTDAKLTLRRVTPQPVDFYYSPWLAKRSDKTYFYNGAKPGTFLALFTINPATKKVASIMITPGNKP